MELLEGKSYHIVNRGNNKQDVFLEKENYWFFLRRMDKYLVPHFEILSYCLLPNHFHLFLKVKPFLTQQAYGPGLNPAEKAFKNLMISYSKAFNKWHNRIGSLFAPKPKKLLVDDDRYFTHLIYYINFNPVKHQLVKKIEDWEYTSYHDLLEEGPTILAREAILEWFGGKTQFVQFQQDQLEEEGLNRYMLEL